MHMSLRDQLLRKAFSYQNDLTAYAYALTRDWFMAQDAYQEALIAMNSKTNQIEIHELFNWLKRVTRNKAVDMIRKQESLNRTTQQLINLIDMKFDKNLDDDKREKRALEEKALAKCMFKLRPEARELIVYFYKKKVSCVKLSKIFKKSENALRLLLSRSRSALKDCVKKEFQTYE